MSNRFKKSIESIEQDNDKNQIEPDIKTDKQSILVDNINSNILTTILDNIVVNEKRGKNITFYLSSEVDEAITRISKQKKTSKSKLIDNILRQILLNQ